MVRCVATVLTATVCALVCVAVNACSGDTSPLLKAPFTDRFYESFDNGEYESQYHLFSSGIDASHPVGLMVFADGSGGEGFFDPESTYLLDADGGDGLVAVARKHNMILITPIAPPPGCDDEGNPHLNRGDAANCWFDPDNAVGKAAWSSDLIYMVKDEFDIDADRIVVGGFSSGAQWATQYWAPAHGEEHSVDLTVAIGYGGAPIATPNFSQDYKAETAFAWNTGTADDAYRADRYGSIGGYSWYTDRGFNTHATWPKGVGHDRPEQFHHIMDREIIRFLEA